MGFQSVSRRFIDWRSEKRALVAVFIGSVECCLRSLLGPNDINIASRLQAYPASNEHHPSDVLAMLGPLLGCGWLRPRGGRRRRSP